MKIFLLHTSLKESLWPSVFQEIKNFLRKDNEFYNLQPLSVTSSLADCSKIADRLYVEFAAHPKHRALGNFASSLTPVKMAEEILNSGHSIVLASVHYGEIDWQNLLQIFHKHVMYQGQYMRFSKEILYIDTEKENCRIFQ